MDTEGCCKKLSQAIKSLPDRSQTQQTTIDPYVARSALQKALRRGDAELATQAAVCLLRDSQRLWRAIAVILFEDFGSLPIDLASQVLAVAAFKKVRTKLGSDYSILCWLIELLCRHARDRRVDDLYTLADCAREVGLNRAERAKLGPDLIEVLMEAQLIAKVCEKPVPRRSFKTVSPSHSDRYIQTLRAQELIDHGELELCIQGRKTTGTLLPVISALLRASKPRQSSLSLTIQKSVPEVIFVGGAPSYALDGFTRPGREALSLLLQSRAEVARLVTEVLPRAKRMRAIQGLLFDVEGGVCTLEITDPFHDRLKAVTEGRWSGLPRDQIADGLRLMRTAIPELNGLREATYAPYVP